MRIREIKYSEYVGLPNTWVLTNFELTDINLLVGKNSAGKTRTAKVIFGITQIFAGKTQKGLDSGNYEVMLENEGDIYTYKLSINEGLVSEESLHINSELKLNRSEDGVGKIFYEEEQKFLKFKAPKDVIAIAHKQDEIQHSFLVPLISWGESSEMYHFGTDFGRQELVTRDHVQSRMETPLETLQKASNIIEVYLDGYRRFGEEFDKAIMEDMRLLGYDLVDVGCTNIPVDVPGLTTSIFGLFVQEKDVEFHILQSSMSQGMYRALALTISLGYSIFDSNKNLIVVDDIGEGLDFSRSNSLIELLITKVKTSGSQLVMTTNDQFVMNKVPLEYWSILTRTGTTVSVINERNSPKEFEDFKFIGLNNFDFFASNYFM
ncbi:MAG: AAA family ATPase [Pseudomonas sp.]|uniref:AAA family ATPase n=1 Tax=Pseudomonas sp. TaxID=306 RepID=UPI003D114E8A